LRDTSPVAGTLALVDPLFELGLAIKAVQRELERQANEAMRALGLTGAQADVVAVIGQAGTLSLKELGELVIAEAGHPSRLVDRLVEAGIVERVPGSDDRRRVELSLTARGRRLAKQIAAARADLIEAGRLVIGDLDVEPALELARRLLEHTPHAALIERRRELMDRSSPA